MANYCIIQQGIKIGFFDTLEHSQEALKFYVTNGFIMPYIEGKNR